MTGLEKGLIHLSTVWPMDAALPLVMALVLLGVPSCSSSVPRIAPHTGASTLTGTSSKGAEKMTLTILYDNNPYHMQLRTDWGFSCLIQHGETRVLFDTGGDGGILMSNMSRMGLASVGLDHVVLSHAHGDHTGGLGSLLATGLRPVVWVPGSFPASFQDRLRSMTEIRQVSGPCTVEPGIHSTGELGSAIIEQSLVLESDRGLVLITGCAHPGIVEIATRTKELHAGELYLVAGGFHLGGKSQGDLQQIVSQLRNLEVVKLAPCHCTGDQAMRVLAQEWGADYLPCGVGRVIEVPL